MKTDRILRQIVMINGDRRPHDYSFRPSSFSVPYHFGSRRSGTRNTNMRRTFLSYLSLSYLILVLCPQQPSRLAFL